MKTILFMLLFLYSFTMSRDVTVTFYEESKTFELHDSVPYLDAMEIIDLFEEQHRGADNEAIKKKLQRIAKKLHAFDIEATNRDFYAESVEKIIEREFRDLDIVIDSSFTMTALGRYHNFTNVLELNYTPIIKGDIEVFLLTIFHELTHYMQDRDGKLGRPLTMAPVYELQADVVAYDVYTDTFGRPSLSFETWLYSLDGLMSSYNPGYRYHYSLITKIVTHLRVTTLFRFKFTVGGFYVRY